MHLVLKLVDGCIICYSGYVNEKRGHEIAVS